MQTSAQRSIKMPPSEISFKGGSTQVYPEPKTFLSSLSPISGTRFLLRVVVCHIPKIWNVKINKIGSLFACLGLKIHKELKLFENYIELLLKMEFSKTFVFKIIINPKLLCFQGLKS